MPVGSTYTITEPSLPNGYTNKSIDNGTGKVTAGTAQEVTVTNTYKPAGITVDPDTDSYPFKAEKILNGRDWQASDTFTFRLQAVDGAPLPKEPTGSNGIRYTECTVTGKTGTAGTSVPITFGSVTFTKPGTYEYNITEIPPTDKIPGVSYDNASYHVTVTITDDGNGQLAVDSPSMVKVLGNDQQTPATTATFTNTYSAEPVEVTLTAHKTLDVKVGKRDLRANEFSFELREKLPDGTVSDTPITATNAADGTVTFAPLTVNAVGKKTYIIR